MMMAAGTNVRQAARRSMNDALTVDQELEEDARYSEAYHSGRTEPLMTTQPPEQAMSSRVKPEVVPADADEQEYLSAGDHPHLQLVADAARRGAIIGTRRLDKTRAELRDFARRIDSSALSAAELRRLRLDLRRREGILLLLGGLVLIMSALYGALIFSSPQLLGYPRNEFGCVIFGGTWAQSPTGKDYCIFWAH
jgi:hypothetical protein